MSDPLGLISSTGGAGQLPKAGTGIGAGQAKGPSFKSVLMENLDQVNALQQDADRATEDLLTGQRDDLAGVIAATQKADTAFKMLQAMRNQVMQAYEEIQQMRV